MSPLKLSVRTEAEGEPAGFDSAITSVPRGWYAVIRGERVFAPQVAARKLRLVSEMLAREHRRETPPRYLDDHR